MTSALAATEPSTFTIAHITLTAVITGVLVLAAAVWRLPRGAWSTSPPWRSSRSPRCCCGDGRRTCPSSTTTACRASPPTTGPLPSSATWFLGLYADLRPPADPGRYNQTRALAFLASLAINVITI